MCVRLSVCLTIFAFFAKTSSCKPKTDSVWCSMFVLRLLVVTYFLSCVNDCNYLSFASLDMCDLGIFAVFVICIEFVINIAIVVFGVCFVVFVMDAAYIIKEC